MKHDPSQNRSEAIADRVCGLAFRVSLLMFLLIVAAGGTRYIAFLAKGRTTVFAWDAKTMFAASAVSLSISLSLALIAAWRIRRAIWLLVVQLPFWVLAWKLFFGLGWGWI